MALCDVPSLASCSFVPITRPAGRHFHPLDVAFARPMAIPAAPGIQTGGDGKCSGVGWGVGRSPMPIPLPSHDTTPRAGPPFLSR